MEMSPVDQRWYDLICQCRSSGLSDKQWCMEQGICTSTFYRHARKLKDLACDLPAGVRKKLPIKQEVVKLQVLDCALDSKNTSPAEISPLSAEIQPHIAVNSEQKSDTQFFRAAMRVHLSGSISIEVSDLADPSMVAGVIRLLEGRC